MVTCEIWWLWCPAAVALLFLYNLYFTSQRGPEAAGPDAKRYRSSGSLKEGGCFLKGRGGPHCPKPSVSESHKAGSQALFKDLFLTSDQGLILIPG